MGGLKNLAFMGGLALSSVAPTQAQTPKTVEGRVEDTKTATEQLLAQTDISATMKRIGFSEQESVNMAQMVKSAQENLKRLRQNEKMRGVFLSVERVKVPYTGELAKIFPSVDFEKAQTFKELTGQEKLTKENYEAIFTKLFEGDEKTLERWKKRVEGFGPLTESWFRLFNEATPRLTLGNRIMYKQTLILTGSLYFYLSRSPEKRANLAPQTADQASRLFMLMNPTLTPEKGESLEGLKIAFGEDTNSALKYTLFPASTLSRSVIKFPPEIEDISSAARAELNKALSMFIEGLDAAVSSTATDIEIARNKTKIAQNKTEIAKNKTEIAQNKTEIAKNKTEIAQNKTEIAYQEIEIKFKNTLGILYKQITADIDLLEKSNTHGREAIIQRLQGHIGELKILKQSRDEKVASYRDKPFFNKDGENIFNALYNQTLTLARLHGIEK